MVKALVINEFGGPEALSWEDVPVPPPGPGEVRLRHTAIGMNLMEIGLRMGTYPGPPLPFIPGVEAAAVVEATGNDVSTCKPGDRVGYAGLPVGSYAQERVFPADRLFPIPDDIPDDVAAASMVKGMTAEYLTRLTYPVGQGTRVLIHAAAGATGTMVVQLARHLGAEVFGTVSTQAKADFIAAHGCHHPIVYTRDDFSEIVLEATGGAGVDVVYDSVGADTFEGSQRCLSPFGTLALFGIASGHPPPLELMMQDLLTSRFFIRPSLYAYTAGREALLDIAARTFELIRQGALQVEITGRFPLREAPEVHRAVEARQTHGSLVYLP